MFLFVTSQQWLLPFVTPLINSVVIVLDVQFFLGDKLNSLTFSKNIVEYILT